MAAHHYNLFLIFNREGLLGLSPIYLLLALNIMIFSKDFIPHTHSQTHPHYQPPCPVYHQYLLFLNLKLHIRGDPKFQICISQIGYLKK